MRPGPVHGGLQGGKGIGHQRQLRPHSSHFLGHCRVHASRGSVRATALKRRRRLSERCPQLFAVLHCAARQQDLAQCDGAVGRDGHQDNGARSRLALRPQRRATLPLPAQVFQLQGVLPSLRGQHLPPFSRPSHWHTHHGVALWHWRWGGCQHQLLSRALLCCRRGVRGRLRGGSCRRSCHRCWCLCWCRGTCCCCRCNHTGCLLCRHCLHVWLGLSWCRGCTTLRQGVGVR